MTSYPQAALHYAAGLLIALLLACSPAAAQGSPADGQRLAHFLDSLDVEHHWPVGVHIDWETGIPDGKQEHMPGKHTHCSAFVASAAKRLGVYILRPPEHGQILLANAQFDWLQSEGAAHGWRPVADGYQAQLQANGGTLVVAVYKNHSDEKPGHIAIIRPATLSRADVQANGPEITQAGGHNYSAVTMRQGFADHPAALRDGEARYYAHDIPPGAIR